MRSEQNERDVLLNDTREETSGPFGSFKRSATGPLNTALNAPSSPWGVGPPSASFGSMGTFGSFALGPVSATNDGPEQRSGFGSMRGESRFKGLLSKSSTEDISQVVKEKSSIGNLGKLPEVENVAGYQNWDDPLRTRPGRSDTNPYGDDLPRTGSAMFVGAQESGQGMDQLGFSAFGLPSNNSGARDMMQSATNQDPSYHQTPQSRPRGQEHMSPTNTNPYQSPEAGRSDHPDHDHDEIQMQQRATFGFGSRDEPGTGSFNPMRRGVSSATEDRSQTSSAGPNRGFVGLGGMGGFSGFGSSAWSGAAGPPNKERGGFSSGFGDPVFGMGDLQSPNIPGLGSSNFFGSPPVHNTPTVNRPSKLGALFPQAPQDQRVADKAGGEGPERQADFATRIRGVTGLEANFGRRDQEAHRVPSGFFGDMNNQDTNMRHMHSNEDAGFPEGLSSFSRVSASGSSQNLITSPSLAQAANITAAGEMVAQPGQSQSSGSPASNQLPAAQQRQMVMPDRMRWIYRDPSGTTQGPWSGLEMHDWFKAGFFTAELQVKKLEDVEYEPLAQLVRRIGNSREPFLVPQIGVPHGPAAPSQGNHWAAQSGTSAPGSGPPQPGAAQPPFASSFPSFGTTLTAEQQNALERRKQEEQYLMARQKEHLAQQQVLLKQMQLQGGPHSLHSLQHHSSAHSLHSQPSFGSIASPSGYQPSPIQGPIQPPQNGPTFMEGSMRQPQSSQFGGDFRGSREDELPNLLDRMNVARGAPFPFTSAPFSQHPDNVQPPPQIPSMLQDRARLHMEQQQADATAQGDAFREGQAFNERLREFSALRAQMEHEEMTLNREAAVAPLVSLPEQQRQPKQEQQKASRQSMQTATEEDGLSLSQQVQQTAAAIGQQPASAAVGENPWSKTDMGLPLFLPPPPTASPLPAPSAQRSRQNVADNLVAESRSQTQTPIDTPNTSIAPWAEKTSESSRGPSLREIQEAEARKAAQREEMAAAARKTQAEHDRLVQPVPPAPGLPSTSTWANAGTPTTPTNPAANVWAKAAVGKPAATTATTTAKKTLAQIQKEEESRKQRQAAAAAVAASHFAVSSTPVAITGKRYADLASKAAAVPAAPAPPAGAWTTVGSSGKAKAPTTVVATPQVSGRTTSSSGMTTAAAAAAPAAPAARPRPSVQTRPSATVSNQMKAADELGKWAKMALGKGLNGNINGE